MKGDKFPNLVRLVDQLRGPDGCPWDRQQSFDTLKPMLLEEAYEVLEAMDTNDHKAFCDELGDLLFQIVFLSQIAEEISWKFLCSTLRLSATNQQQFLKENFPGPFFKKS